MTQPSPNQGPWRVTADTVPGMEYDSYRQTLIHETSEIRAFLAPRQTERTILVAPKGYGKTLLLIAKKKSFEKDKSSILMGQDVFIDRPVGPFPILNRKHLERLALDYDFWKSVWKLAIALAAVKAFARSTRGRESKSIYEGIYAGDNEWFRKVLNEDSKHFEASEIFTDLVVQPYRTILDVLRASHFVFREANRINTTVVFFIDNVDQYFTPVLEDRSQTHNEDILYRNRDNRIWSLAQLALASAAYQLGTSNPHLKIFCTMRQEAYLRLNEVENDAFQISGECVQIKYSPSDLHEIFLKNIGITGVENLVEPESGDLMTRFVGRDNLRISHRFVAGSERMFDYLLRHTLSRPRDLMWIGDEISKIDPTSRSTEAIQRAVDSSTTTIVSSILGEMRPFFAVPARRRLFPHISTNVLTSEQLKEAAELYAKESPNMVDSDQNDEIRHPFCVLHKLGLLGSLRLDFESHDVWKQAFLRPTEIQIGGAVQLPESKYYLLHPALDQSVHELTGGRFARLYHRHNILGNGLSWIDPVTHSFVLKGDIVGYSQIMTSELYHTATQKLYEWAMQACRELLYVDVSGGDSIVMIDNNPAKLVHSARELARLAAGFREQPMQIRFGGAAGQIVFSDVRRIHEGVTERARIPLGLALRTSSRLEPHAESGSILVDAMFHEFSVAEKARAEANAMDGGVRGFLEESEMVAVVDGSAQGLPYDSQLGVFIVQKGPLDAPYRTRLWKVKLT